MNLNPTIEELREIRETLRKIGERQTVVTMDKYDLARLVVRLEARIDSLQGDQRAFDSGEELIGMAHLGDA